MRSGSNAGVGSRGKISRRLARSRRIGTRDWLSVDRSEKATPAMRETDLDRAGVQPRIASAPRPRRAPGPWRASASPVVLGLPLVPPSTHHHAGGGKHPPLLLAPGV